MPGKKWTDKETALLDALHAEGKHDSEISVILGRTQKSVHARRHREWFQAQRHTVSAAEGAFFVSHERAVQVIAQMIRHGCSRDAIAERLGSTSDRVNGFIQWHRDEIEAAIRTPTRHAKA